MNEQDRCTIVFSIGIVDEVLLSGDTDSTVCKTIEQMVQFHQEDGIDYEFIFCNGGDRKVSEIPETEVCVRLGIEMRDGLGEKIRSSSEITGIK